MVRQSDVSSTRQQSLLRDRLRTKAISLYLADCRQEVAASLSHTSWKTPNMKRKALEAEARRRFKLLSQDEQAKYTDTASGKTDDATSKESPVSAGSSGSGVSGGRPIPPAPSTPPKHVREASPARPTKRCKPMPNPPAQTPPIGASLESVWSLGRSQLHDRLMHTASHLRKLYGDAGALETLAASIRILCAVDFCAWTDSASVKVAVVVGMAAKLTQACDDANHVLKLWAAVAGNRQEKRIRALEHRVLAAWARQGLVSDESLQSLGIDR